MNSDQFKEIKYVKYRDNILKFGGTSRATRSFLLFEGCREWFPPRWFEFAKWSAFKAYVVERQRIDFDKIRLLLYNPDLGQAYFVDYEVRSAGVGLPWE
jgi:hypothetical protein